MKEICATLLFVLAFGAHALLAQNSITFEEGKTVECKALSVQRGTDGAVYQVRYVTKEGERQNYNGKDQIPEFISYTKNGIQYDLMPTNLKKNKEKLFIQQQVGGAVKVYADKVGRNYAPTKSSAKNSGPNRLYFVDRDGTTYDASDKKVFKDVISKRLFACPGFRANYKKALSNDAGTLIEMAKIYNEHCQ